MANMFIGGGLVILALFGFWMALVSFDQDVIRSHEECDVRMVDGLMQTKDCQDVNEYTPVPIWRWAYVGGISLFALIYLIWPDEDDD